MTRILGVLLAALALTFAPGCDPGSGMRTNRRDAGRGGDGGDGPTLPDQDGDGIPDQAEGRTSNVDTDSDGTPDYLDDDSDGDGLSDMIEGGVMSGVARDSDRDGTPDFRDLDSDANGIDDATEGAGDPDGDGIPDADDLDNDGDHVEDTDELGPDPTMPRDIDHDGTPDWYDLDSDDDTIGDIDESTSETDGDGTPDRWDQDSDNDGYSDSMEAGDTMLTTPPVDTDGDHVADFRDTDSDNDGLADSAELTANTNPRSGDTDMDGVSDLVEVASMTDPLNMNDSPRTHGDFVFVEPYQMPPAPPRDTLDFATNITSADVYFLIDRTGSMQGSIDNVRSSLSSSGGIIDQIRAMITDANFGVGNFEDYSDVALYQNNTDITASAAAAQMGVNMLAADNGFDTPEGDVPALYATASGNGITNAPYNAVPPRTGCPAGTFGYPCFRNGAVPIIILVTDAPFHNGPTGGYPYSGYTGWGTMITEIQARHIRVIGVAIGTDPQADLNQLALDSDAVDGAGQPLVTVTSAGSVSSTVVNQVQTLAQQTRFDISTNYVDDPSDAIDTRTAFVDHIEANTAGDATRHCDPRAAVDTNGDGYLDTFQGVTAGTRVCFDIIVHQNDTVMPTAMPQLFRANVQVVGDGFTVLSSRAVYFLVPPVVPPAGPS